MTHIIAIGNEKGGVGKTTTAMHIIVSFLKLGFTVGSIDLDTRQRSLSRYLENRKKVANQFQFMSPEHITLEPNKDDSIKANQDQDQKLLEDTINQLSHNDFILIDTPGSHTFLGQIAHRQADTIITPINDSFVDVDLIGKIDLSKPNNIAPGIYSAMVWEQKMKRAASTKKTTNWVVVRNRLSNLHAHNKVKVGETLTKLSKKFGFTIAPGFSDRVIFKELFPYGLTLNDTNSTNLIKTSASVLAARQELISFIKALNIKQINDRLVKNSNIKNTGT